MFGKMKDLGRAIAGQIVELDASVSPQAAPTSPLTPLVPSPVGTPSAGYSSPTQFSYDPEMYAALQKAIMSRRTPYTALLESSEKMRSIIPDDTTRIKAAFVSASDGRTPADVLKSIDIHISDLDGERGRFKQSSARQVNERCDAPRSQAKSLTDQAATMQREITDLQARIQTLSDQIRGAQQQAQQLVTDADGSEREIQAVSERFDKTVEYAKSELSDRKVQLSRVLSA